MCTACSQQRFPGWDSFQQGHTAGNMPEVRKTLYISLRLILSYICVSTVADDLVFSIFSDFLQALW